MYFCVCKGTCVRAGWWKGGGRGCAGGGKKIPCERIVCVCACDCVCFTPSLLSVTPPNASAILLHLASWLRLYFSSEHEYNLHPSRSPDGTKLAAGCMDGSVAVWDLASQKLLGRCGGHHKPVRSLTFTAGAGWAAVGAVGGGVVNTSPN